MLLRPGMKVVDVGAAPGGWSQILAEKVNSIPGKETVVAVDLLEMEKVDGVKFIQADIEKEQTFEKISELLDFEKADLVCSDAVPDFVGERFVDHMRSVELNYMILNLCQKNLRKGGNLLMKIMQGPSEKQLFDDAKLLFEKLQRVKPSASRQESKEIYLLGHGYEQSKEQAAQDLEKEKKKIMSLKTNEEKLEFISDFSKKQKEFLQELIDQCLKDGVQFPDELKERIRNMPGGAGKDINVESKMDMQERLKARKQAEEKFEKDLYEQTGLYDQSKHLTMNNLIKKYEYDMERFERKMAKMDEFEKKGINYDMDDIKLTDDEGEGSKDFFDKMHEENLKKEKEYMDEPYKAQEEEQSNYETQLQNIERRIKDLTDKTDGSKLTKESEYFNEYTQLLDDFEDFTQTAIHSEAKTMHDELIRDELKEDERVVRSEKLDKSSYFKKRDIAEELKKRYGSKKESKLWDDE